MAPAEQSNLTHNVSGGMVGLQPYPSAANADGTVDIQQLLSCVNRAPDVERSYSETIMQGFNCSGAPLPDQTLGPDRDGYRGMADEPLPSRPLTPDHDDDYDND